MPRSLARPPWMRRTLRAFTLLELMVVIVVISLLAIMAVPSMLRARNERRAIGAASNFTNAFREARSRAAGRGAAQLLVINVGPGAGQRGKVRSREAVDDAGNPFPNCRTANWQNANTLATEAGVLDLNGGVDAQSDLESSAVVEGALASNFVLCFAPNGRVYQSNAIGNLGQAQELSQALRIDVTQVLSGTKQGRSRSVLLTPNGQARVQTRLGS